MITMIKNLINSKQVKNLGGRYVPLFFSLMNPFSLVKASDTFTVEDICEKVNAHNVAVTLATIDYQLAKSELRASNHPLDYQLVMSHYKENSEEPRNSSLENPVVSEVTEGQSFGLTKTFSMGTKVELSAQSMSISSDSINAIAPIRNQSAMLLNIKQPLLSGRSESSRLTDKLKAPFKLERYKIKLKEKFNQEVEKAINNYLDLYELKNKLSVNLSNLKIYERLFKFYSKASKIGQKNKIKKFEAKALLSKESALLKKTESEFYSKQLSFFKLTGIENISSEKITTLNLQDYMNLKSFKYARLDQQQLGIKIREAEIDYKKEKDEALPNLELELEYLSPGLSRNRARSFDIISKQTFPNILVALNFSWSFGSNNAKKRALAAKHKYELQNLKFKRDTSRNNFKEKKINFEINAYGKLGKEYTNQIRDYEEKVEIRERLYKSGQISILDFQETVQEFARVRTDFIKNSIKRFKLLNERWSKMALYSRNYVD